MILVPRASRHLAALFAAAWSLACATSGTRDPGAPAAPAGEPPAAAAPEAAPAPDRTGALLEPPDGEWLIDEEGRRYFVIDVPKREGNYMFLEPNVVRLRYGAVYDVLSHDDQNFKVKIYEVPKGGKRRGEKPGPPEAELEAVAATYVSEAGTSDRLTFAAFDRGLPDEGQWRNGFDLADFDGDGHRDIVLGPARRGNRAPNIFLGDGAGGWRRQKGLQLERPGGYDYGDVAVADFNGDGRLDLGLAVHLRGVVVLVADGDGRFREWSGGMFYSAPGEPPRFSARALEAVDWNRDGKMDLVALGEGPLLGVVPRPVPSQTEARAQGAAYGMSVFLNRGDGTWEARGDNSVAARVFGDSLDVADLDGDERPDAVVGSNVLGYKELLRLSDEAGRWHSAPLEAARPRSYIQAVHIADLDADGRNDLILGYAGNQLGVWRSGVDLFYRQADATWRRRVLYVEETRNLITAVGGGDLDGDGRADVAALTGRGETLVFLGNAAGFFDREASPELTPAEGCRGYDVEIGDLDGDGGGELVAAFAGEPDALFAPDKCVKLGRLEAWKAGSSSGRQADSKPGG